MSIDLLRRRDRGWARSRAAILATATVLLAGGCSLERAFCGSDPLACEAQADYVWAADAR